MKAADAGQGASGRGCRRFVVIAARGGERAVARAQGDSYNDDAEPAKHQWFGVPGARRGRRRGRWAAGGHR